MKSLVLPPTLLLALHLGMPVSPAAADVEGRASSHNSRPQLVQRKRYVERRHHVSGNAMSNANAIALIITPSRVRSEWHPTTGMGNVSPQAGASIPRR